MHAIFSQNSSAMIKFCQRAYLSVADVALGRANREWCSSAAGFLDRETQPFQLKSITNRRAAAVNSVLL